MWNPPAADSVSRKRFLTGSQDNHEGYGWALMELLKSFRWPGNVRELEHVIERACVLCHGATITREDLPREIFEYDGDQQESHETGKKADNLKDGEPYKVDVAADNLEPENERILRVLRQTAGNKAMAARILGFDRSTLYRKIRNYGIDSSAL